MNTARLFKLAGMRYKQGYFNAVEWTVKTGVNPREFPQYIFITQGGWCFWTDKAETLYQTYSNQVERNWRAIGARCK